MRGTAAARRRGIRIITSNIKIMQDVSINKNARLSQHLTLSSVATLGNLSELDCTRLSPHFTLGELCKTSAKTQDGNIPSHVHIENLKRLCGWLEELRRRWNNIYGDGDDPIIINSGFRSSEVNKAVGGVPTSNHTTGCAVDIRCIGIEQLMRYATILLDISDLNNEDFDELLLERNAKGTYWLHFAVRPEGNRRKIRLIQT